MALDCLWFERSEHSGVANDVVSQAQAQFQERLQTAKTMSQSNIDLSQFMSQLTSYDASPSNKPSATILDTTSQARHIVNSDLCATVTVRHETMTNTNTSEAHTTNNSTPTTHTSLFSLFTACFGAPPPSTLPPPRVASTHCNALVSTSVSQMTSSSAQLETSTNEYDGRSTPGRRTSTRGSPSADPFLTRTTSTDTPVQNDAEPPTGYDGAHNPSHFWQAEQPLAPEVNVPVQRQSWTWLPGKSQKRGNPGRLDEISPHQSLDQSCAVTATSVSSRMSAGHASVASSTSTSRAQPQLHSRPSLLSSTMTNARPILKTSMDVQGIEAMMERQQHRNQPGNGLNNGLGVGMRKSCSIHTIGQGRSSKGDGTRPVRVSGSLSAVLFKGSGVSKLASPPSSPMQTQRNGSVIYSKDDVEVLGLPLQQLMSRRDSVNNPNTRMPLRSYSQAPNHTQPTARRASTTNNIDITQYETLQLTSIVQELGAKISGAVGLGAPLVSAALDSSSQTNLQQSLTDRVTSASSVTQAMFSDAPAPENETLPMCIKQAYASVANQDAQFQRVSLMQPPAVGVGVWEDRPDRISGGPVHTICRSMAAATVESINTVTFGGLESIGRGEAGSAGHNTPVASVSGLGPGGASPNNPVRSSSTPTVMHMRMEAETALRLACMLNQWQTEQQRMPCALSTGSLSELQSPVEGGQPGCASACPGPVASPSVQLRHAQTAFQNPPNSSLSTVHGGEAESNGSGGATGGGSPGAAQRWPSAISLTKAGVWAASSLMSTTEIASTGTQLVTKGQPQSRWLNVAPRATQEGYTAQDDSESITEASSVGTYGQLVHSAASIAWGGRQLGLTACQSSGSGPQMQATVLRTDTIALSVSDSTDGEDVNMPGFEAIESSSRLCLPMMATPTHGGESPDEFGGAGLLNSIHALHSDFEDEDEVTLGEGEEEGYREVIFKYDMSMSSGRDKPGRRLCGSRSVVHEPMQLTTGARTRASMDAQS